eukprot:PITA_31557
MILMDILKDHVVPHVRGNTYAYQMWTTLTSLYQSTNESRKMILKEQLKNIRMTKVESVVHYLGRVKQVSDDLTAIGEAVAPIELVKIVVAGLPKSWEVFGDVVTSRENLPNWDRFWDDCVQCEIWKICSGGVKIADEEDVALIARGKNKGKAKKGASSNRVKGKEKKKKKDMDISKVKCWACQKMGHYATTCTERKNKRKKGTAASAEVEQFASQFDLDFAFITSAFSRSTSSDVWYINSGASRHMTGAREFFSEFAERALDIEIVLRDDRTVRVVGVGTMTFEREYLPPLKVMNVLYVLGIKKNLISVSSMEEKGFHVTFSGGQEHWWVAHLGALTLVTTSSKDLCKLWHQRMAHMHHGALRVLREITTRVPDFNVEYYEVCIGCALGKYTKFPYPVSDNRSTAILDLIHIDVSGRMSHVSLGGYEYYVIFIDGYSRRTWIYFLKTKGEVFSRFKDFKALVKEDRREFTIPYNPQQNGVSERKNRAIIVAARVMIHDQGLPLFLWVEASNTVVYLQKRSPHRVLGNMTLEEAFTGEKPHLAHLRIFGCLTYSYIPKEQRTKLEPMAEKGIFMGYSETSKAYRIFIPSKRRVVNRRDVKFEERAYQRSREYD